MPKLTLRPVNDHGQRVLRALTDGLSSIGVKRRFYRSGEDVPAVTVERRVAYAFAIMGDAAPWDPMIVLLHDGKQYFPVFCKGFGDISADWAIRGQKVEILGLEAERQATHVRVAETWLREIADRLSLDLSDDGTKEGERAALVEH